MSNPLSITNLKTVHVGDSVLVQGKVAPGAQRFIINMGRDASNMLIHFNPRFDDRVVVYNSMQDGSWSTEMRDHHFPFKQGEDTQVLFTFEHDEVKVTYPDGRVFDFKSQSNLGSVDFISVEREFTTHSIKINIK